MEQPERKTPRWRTLATMLINSVLGVAWLWAAMALWYFAPWPAWVRLAALLGWIAGTVVVLTKRWHPRLAIGGGILLIGVFWTSNRPATHRAWTADQQRMPVVSFDDNEVTIENIRHATYRTTDAYDIRWITKTYDLDQITRMDFMIETLTAWGVAHTLMTFGFADGEYVAISVEVRKEVGETYSPLKGLFKQYELMLEDARTRFLINDRSAFGAADGRAWSAQIRQID